MRKQIQITRSSTKTNSDTYLRDSDYGDDTTINLTNRHSRKYNTRKRIVTRRINYMPKISKILAIVGILFIFIGLANNLRAEEIKFEEKPTINADYKYMSNKERLEVLKKETPIITPKEEKKPVEVKKVVEKGGIPITAYVEKTVNNKGVDIDLLAKAVAWTETHDCKLGYGKEYNNCFGIKNGNTAPCKKIGRNNMCIYDKPEDSYEAFKIIWSKWYKTLPNMEQAKRWSGNDRADHWLRNVHSYYATYEK